MVCLKKNVRLKKIAHAPLSLSTKEFDLKSVVLAWNRTHMTYTTFPK